MTEHRTQRLGQALRWALDDSNDSSMAAADWLAVDICPECRSAVALLTDPDTPLDALRRAKEAYKTMRMVGEHAADRRLAARLYLAAIAAALVHHGARISTQSDAALERAIQDMLNDENLPRPLMTLAQQAVVVLDIRHSH